MSLSDLVVRAEAERADAAKVSEYRGSHVRLPEDLWQRLDVIAEELGWSRNRLIVELIEEGSCDLAALMSRDGKGKLDKDRFTYLTGLSAE